MLIKSLVAAILAVSSIATAAAQSYPNKPIRWIVPYPPGGGTETMGRIVGDKMGEILGVPVIVTPTPGGSGILGSDMVRRSDPDGYTVLFQASIFILGRHIVKATPYDPITDFTPIAGIGEVPLIAVSNLNVPAKTLPELVTLMKAEPGRFNIGVSSLGAAGHIAALAFLHQSGTKAALVNYRGAALAMTDVLGGSIELLIETMTTTLPHVKDKRVRAYAITAKERSKAAPEIPTSAEGGMPDLIVSSWYGVWGPPNMPPEVVARLSEAVARVSKDPAVLERFAKIGILPTYRPPEEFRAFTKKESEWGIQLLRDAKFEPQ